MELRRWGARLGADRVARLRQAGRLSGPAGGRGRVPAHGRGDAVRPRGGGSRTGAGLRHVARSADRRRSGRLRRRPHDLVPTDRGLRMDVRRRGERPRARADAPLRARRRLHGDALGDGRPRGRRDRRGRGNGCRRGADRRDRRVAAASRGRAAGLVLRVALHRAPRPDHRRPCLGVRGRRGRGAGGQRDAHLSSRGRLRRDAGGDGRLRRLLHREGNRDRRRGAGRRAQPAAREPCPEPFRSPISPRGRRRRRSAPQHRAGSCSIRGAPSGAVGRRMARPESAPRQRRARPESAPRHGADTGRVGRAPSGAVRRRMVGRIGAR